MNARHNSSSTDHDRSARRHYNELTHRLYMEGWNSDHIHFGLFEAGECPELGGPWEDLPASEGLARAVERMVDVVVEPAGIRENDRVVDAGCGVGGTALRLAKLHGCSVTGVNISEVQLEIAGEKARAAGLDDRVRFAWADCSQSLPFADGSVDAVVNIESACHYSDRGRFLREVRRILKPGGRIAAMDWLARDGLSPDLYGKYIQPICDEWSILSLESRSSYTELLRESGLAVVESEGFDGRDMDNMRIVGDRYRWLFMLWFGGLKGTDHPNFRQQMRLFQTLSVAWRDGHFELGRYCAEKPGDA